MTEKLYEQFTNNLKNRIEKYGVEKLSEDCIRYEYFSLLENKENIILEYPHPKHKGRKIDCVIMNEKKQLKEAVEFKYFSKKNKDIPRLTAIGYLLADCYRLLDLVKIKKTLVLLSMDPMTKYINDKNNNFQYLFSKKNKKIIINLANEERNSLKNAIENEMPNLEINYSFNIKISYIDSNKYFTLVIYDIDFLRGC